MNLKEKVYNMIANSKLKYENFSRLHEMIAKQLGADKKAVSKAFYELLEEGTIVENGRKVVSSAQYGLKKGKLIGNARGFAFCQVFGETVGKKNDLFIPPNKLKGAMDGDTVLVNPIVSNGKTEGEVIKVLNVSNNTVVGTLKSEGNFFVVESDNTKFSKPVVIRKSKLNGAEIGNKVVVKITKHPTGLRFEKIEGEVIEILGNENDPSVLELAIVRAHNLYEEFTEKVIEESKKVPQTVSPDKLQNRLDLTNELIFTIDGADAKDLDDAVSIDVLANGNWKLGVHIADVGEYVKYGSVLDEEAYLRGTSAYFPSFVLPMLPKSLSNGICSLNPNVTRLTLSVFIELDKDAKVVNYSMHESFIKSVARLTYDEVYAVICGDFETTKRYANIANKMIQMNELAKLLEKKRSHLGSLDFDIPEAYIVCDDSGEPIEIKKRERNDAHKLIESFMILCNEVVAKHFNTKKLPFVYRVHETPSKEKIENLVEFASSLGMAIDPLPIVVDPKFVQNMIVQANGKPYAETLNKVMLRSMQKARYLERCLGHFGLALTNYCHFTSPIRRYPDLVIHRILKDEINKRWNAKKLSELSEFVVDASFRSSEREKNAEEAEREVDDLKKAQFMLKHLGEEFEGTISGVTGFGLFIELQNTVEGFVKLESLPGGNYVFDEKQIALKHPGKTFRLGDKVKIKVVSANVYTRKIDFDLIG